MSEACEQPVAPTKNPITGNYFTYLPLNKLFFLQTLAYPDIQKLSIHASIWHIESKEGQCPSTFRILNGIVLNIRIPPS
ncbi:hypothetical protein D9M71_839260 [compost metagenome]